MCVSVSARVRACVLGTSLQHREFRQVHGHGRQRMRTRERGESEVGNLGAPRRVRKRRVGNKPGQTGAVREAENSGVSWKRRLRKSPEAWRGRRGWNEAAGAGSMCGGAFPSPPGQRRLSPSAVETLQVSILGPAGQGPCVAFQDSA